jgi:DNA-binding transcriptional regulator GbsR (MarR family)
MTKKQRMLVKELQKKVLQRREEIKGNQKDYYIVYQSYKNEDYTLAYKTKLYNLCGGEYCTLLEVLAAMV